MNIEELQADNMFLREKLALFERRNKTLAKKVAEFEKSSFIIADIDAVLNTYFVVSGTKHRDLIKNKGPAGFSEFLWETFSCKEEPDCLAD